MKIAILGYGVVGKAVEQYLRKHRPETEITILDQKDDPDYLKRLTEFDLVYRSPGVLYSLPEIRSAIRKGVEFSSSINLFFENAKGTVIGITGTKGKGTTSQLIYEILKADKRDVYLGGNIGISELSFLDKLTKDSISVIELSNVQLWDIKYSPHIAGVLGIFPDHLDWHKNFKEYFGTKLNMARYQKPDDFVFYIQDNKFSRRVAKKSKGHKVAVDPESIKIPLSIPGEHNRRNAAMAAAICTQVGVRPEIVLEVIKDYRGLPYRLTRADVKRGVIYINDSASTNPQTTCAAIKSFPDKQKILIAGGFDKGLNYNPLRDTLRNEGNIKLVVLYGANRDKIKDVLKDEVPIKMVNGPLEKVVELVSRQARAGDIVIFSPGAASFDMFTNYQERGDIFSEIVKNIKD